jgi:glycosyltransferase involved in cell wall biosynthesis
LILLQALATHTPVIVSDVEGMTEFVEHGRSGLHFKRSDVNSLAAALKRFTDDPALARKMSLATSYERTPRDMVQDILMMYEKARQPVVAGP